MYKRQLEALRGLDTIAYIRFASVYFNVNEPEGFIEMIERAVEPAKRTFDVEAFKALAHKDALEEKEKRRQMRIRRDGSEKA